MTILLLTVNAFFDDSHYLYLQKSLLFPDFNNKDLDGADFSRSQKTAQAKDQVYHQLSFTSLNSHPTQCSILKTDEENISR